MKKDLPWHLHLNTNFRGRKAENQVFLALPLIATHKIISLYPTPVHG